MKRGMPIIFLVRGSYASGAAIRPGAAKKILCVMTTMVLFVRVAMTKKELSMHDLIRKTGKPTGIMLSVPANIRPKIKADLLEVLKAKHAGMKVPGCRVLSVFFQEKYDYHVSYSCINDWLKRLEKETHDS